MARNKASLEHALAEIPKLRDDFRGTAFHNTICIDKLNQAEPAGPFRWNQKPSVSRLNWSECSDMVFLDAECGYRGFRHRRRVLVACRLHR